LGWQASNNLLSVLTSKSDTKDFLRLGANLETIMKVTPSDSRFREETVLALHTVDNSIHSLNAQKGAVEAAGGPNWP
jgi:hypothetical protein